MIEIFRTNVDDSQDADKIIHLLNEQFPGSRINFDLEDCDRILRIEAAAISITSILEIIQGKGFFIDVLE